MLLSRWNSTKIAWTTRSFLREPQTRNRDELQVLRMEHKGDLELWVEQVSPLAAKRLLTLGALGTFWFATAVEKIAQCVQRTISREAVTFDDSDDEWWCVIWCCSIPLPAFTSMVVMHWLRWWWWWEASVSEKKWDWWWRWWVPGGGLCGKSSSWVHPRVSWSANLFLTDIWFQSPNSLGVKWPSRCKEDLQRFLPCFQTLCNR